MDERRKIYGARENNEGARLMNDDRRKSGRNDVGWGWVSSSLSPHRIVPSPLLQIRDLINSAAPFLMERVLQCKVFRREGEEIWPLFRVFRRFPRDSSLFSRETDSPFTSSSNSYRTVIRRVLFRELVEQFSRIFREFQGFNKTIKVVNSMTRNRKQGYKKDVWSMILKKYEIKPRKSS